MWHITTIICYKLDTAKIGLLKSLRPIDRLKKVDLLLRVVLFAYIHQKSIQSVVNDLRSLTFMMLRF